MALEAVVFQHSMAASSGNPWLYEQIEVGEGDKAAPDLQQNGPFLDSFHQRWDATNLDGWDVITTNRDGNGIGVPVESQTPTQVVGGGRRKRRRTKTCKNKEEVENQRMTHIAVERNRRKQMNEYLNVLRSLMPSSYVQRGDQASIVGGAINFVKELEQQLQSLEAQKRSIQQSTAASSSSNSSAQPFADFFTFPQYSTCTSSSSNATPSVDQTAADNNRSTIADIEVTMVESHANLKVFCKRRPKQLLKMVIGLQNIGLTPLHLNVTTIDHKALYSFSLKVEDDCEFTSVDEVADFVHQMLGRIEQGDCVGVGVGVGFNHG